MIEAYPVLYSSLVLLRIQQISIVDLWPVSVWWFFSTDDFSLRYYFFFGLMEPLVINDREISEVVVKLTLLKRNGKYV